MPLNRRNTRTFHKTLYAGMLETVTILKREPNQRQGTVAAFTVYNCRRGQITRQGQTVAGDMDTESRTVWHLPLSELQRVGIAYINVLDRIVSLQSEGTWQPESDTPILMKLFGNMVRIDCRQVGAGR